jgi:hypothetical protein
MGETNDKRRNNMGEQNIRRTVTSKWMLKIEI